MAIAEAGVPTGLTFPSERTYATQLVRAVGAVSTDAATITSATSHDPGASVLSLPVASHVRSLQAVLEKASGMPLGELLEVAGSVASLVTASTAGAIVRAVADVIVDAVQLASSVAEMAGASVTATPVLGQMLGAITALVSEVLDSQARYAGYQRQCEDRLAQQLDLWCGWMVEFSAPKPTGRQASVEPTDLFRQLAYTWLLKRRGANGALVYPANVSTLYLGLCGGEAESLSLWSRASYRAFCERHDIPLIPQHVQRRMWSLIRALMAGARDPRSKGGPVRIDKPDGGRALMPILQDLCNQQRHRGALGRPLLIETVRHAMQWTDQYIECPDLPSGEIGAGGLPAAGGTCASRVERSLVDGFVEGLRQYDTELRWAFVGPDGQWTTEKSTLGQRIAANASRSKIDLTQIFGDRWMQQTWWQTWRYEPGKSAPVWSGWFYGTSSTAQQLARALAAASALGLRFEVRSQSGAAVT